MNELSKILTKEDTSMAFKALFLAHAPDADKEKHQCVIETSKYRLYVVLVKNQEEAIGVSTAFFKDKNIESIILCPGFTHKDVAEIAKSLEYKVAVSVARGDGPSNKISLEARKREGLF
jgi:hypothetical protein